MKKTAAIILAAGKGTRMKSDKPKVTFHFAGKPMIQRVIDTAFSANCDLVTAVVGFKKDEVIKCVTHDSRIRFVEQKEQNGTGHAVIVTKDVFLNYQGDIFILCGDVPMLSSETLNRILEKHRKTNAACTVLTAVMDDALKYGRIVRNEAGNVQKIVEFKDANEEQRAIKEINSGIYCFDVQSMFESLKKIDNDNKQNEYYLTDTLEILNNEGKLVTSVILDDMDEVSGINSQLQLANLESIYYDRIKEYWMNNGVSIENPSSVIIGENVSLDRNTEIAANCVIKGKTVIKSGCKIGLNSYIVNSVLENNVHLKGYNIIKNSKIEKGEKIDLKQDRIADER